MSAIAWAGGYFEGEGCITQLRTGHMAMVVSTTDEDGVRRFCRAVGTGSVRGPLSQARRGKQYKDLWTWRVTTQHQVLDVVALLWPFLGERRRARALEVIEKYGNRLVSWRAKKTS